MESRNKMQEELLTITSKDLLCVCVCVRVCVCFTHDPFSSIEKKNV